MRVEYRFASEGGDLQADLRTLDRPFLLSLGEVHPTLTVRGYFDAVREFFLHSLAAASTKEQSAPNTLIIRSEKHGALYHVASVEVICREESRKFAVSTALSDRARACLTQEEMLLRQLEKSFHLPYLPRPFLKSEVLAEGKVPLTMLMTKWFEAFHEWHLTTDQPHKIRIWDPKRGNRFASEKEAAGLYREASKILTLYYDTETFRQIRPWHHAAGDFVLNSEGEKIRVRLTTVRGYEPLEFLTRAEPLDPNIALIYFFLNLSTKMRLDRADGTGEVIWADDFCLGPVVEGFFDALRIMTGQGRYPLGDPEGFMRLLKVFTEEELKSLLPPLQELYEQENTGDFSVIRANLEKHAVSLREIIRKFPGSSHRRWR